MTAQQLKNSILQMAVQGKLVPQDPNDEPASVLLEHIRTEKEALVKAGKIKKEKNPSVIFRGADNIPYEKVGNAEPVPVEVPFEIPESWEWCRLGGIASILGGKRIPAGRKLSTNDTGHVYIRVSDMKNETVSLDNLLYVPNDIYPLIAQYIIEKEDVYITVAGTIGKVGKVPERLSGANLTENADRLVFNHISQDWLIRCIQSPFVQYQIADVTTKVGQPKLAIAKIQNIFIPLPPLAEQHRIVAKIEELLPYIEKYAQAEKQLNELNSAFPIRLKKSILQLAVQGKLVPQDENDEPASVLLERIREEKKALIKAGKLKKDKNESFIFVRDNVHYENVGGVERCIEDEIPFDIPESWEWVRLNDICEYIQRGKSPKYSTIKKYPVVAQKCNQWSGFSIDKAKFIEPESLKTYGEERILQDKDLLWNSTGLGTLGRIAIYLSELNPYELAVADSHVTVIRPIKQYIFNSYLYFYFSNPTVQGTIEDLADGTTKQKELATSTIKNYFVPIPPLAEQCKIVDCIYQLLPLCSIL